ncbi:MAG: hypothetical protein ACPG49_07600 [Chitinophagales bacterium]
MPSTIIGIAFSIYTLILTATLIWLLKLMQGTHRKHKRLFKNGIRTQGKITKVYHPQKKNTWLTSILGKKKTSNETEEYRIVVVYEYEVKETESTTKTLIGESSVYLDLRNTLVIEWRYKRGDTIDILYLKNDFSIVDIAHQVAERKAESLFVFVNIAAIASSLLVLGLLIFVGLSDAANTVKDALTMVFGFLMYLFMMTGNILIIVGGIYSVKDYFKLRQLKKKGTKEIGKVLEMWKMKESKGAINYFVRYTYPAIAPFSIETTVHRTLNEAIEKNKTIEVRYFKRDKFYADIVGNKETVYAFWLFFILTPIITLFVAFIFYGFVLYGFNFFE